MCGTAGAFGGCGCCCSWRHAQLSRLYKVDSRGPAPPRDLKVGPNFKQQVHANDGNLSTCVVPTECCMPLPCIELVPCCSVTLVAAHLWQFWAVGCMVCAYVWLQRLVNIKCAAVHAHTVSQRNTAGATPKSCQSKDFVLARY